MNQEKVMKAFEALWAEKMEKENNALIWIKGIKAICQQFFLAGTRFAPEVQYVAVPQQPYTGDTNFETWWDMYDKKIDKSGCLKKWNKLKEEDKKECLRLTPAYVASTPVKQFRKHPGTYLNNKSWQDEIIERDNNIHDQSLRVISRLYNERQMDSEVRY